LQRAQTVLAAARAEQDRRRREKTSKLLIYQENPVGFVFEHLYGFLWSAQKTMAEAVRDNRQVAVQSCHDVGKTYMAAILTAWWIACHEPGEAFVVTLAPTAPQVRALLWRELNRIHRQGNLIGRMLTTEWKLENGELVAFGRSPSDTAPTSIQGLHQKYVLVILDEAGGIAKGLWDAVSSMAANEFSRMFAIGNPDDPSTEFHDVCKPGSGWHVIKMNAFESPNFTGEEVPDFLRPLLVSPIWVEERKKKWGEDSPIYRSKVLGQFPEQATDGLIPLTAISAAQVREITPHPTECELGVDVARFGDDHSVAYVRRGSWARRVFRSGKEDTMQCVGRVIEAIRETGATKVKIDDIGVGGGVVDRLKELQNGLDDSPGGKAAYALLRHVEIVPVNVGEAPTVVLDPDDPKYQDTERYLNLRAELNWNLRDRFITGDIDIDPLDDDLAAEAGDIKYIYTSRGQLQIEPKSDLKKRGRESPDDWDALVLAFATSTGTDLGVWYRLAR
jgi:hypothetical protein